MNFLKKHLLLYKFAVLLLCCTPALAEIQGQFAQEEPPSKIEIVKSKLTQQTPSLIPELQTIVDRGKLIVVMNKEENPLFYMKEQDSYVGLDMTMAKILARALNVELEIVATATNNEQVIDSIARGEGDIGISKLSYTTQRAKKVLFTNAYVTPKKALIVNRRNLEKLNKKNSLRTELNKPSIIIGVTSKSSYTDYAKELFPAAQIQDHYKDWDSMLPDLLSGKIFGGFRDEIRVKILLKERPNASLHLYPLILQGELDPLVMVVKKDAPLFLIWINSLLGSGDYKTPEISALIEKYKNLLGRK